VSHRRTGLTRLGAYLTGRWALVGGLILVATVSAAAQSGSWLLVHCARAEQVSGYTSSVNAWLEGDALA